jgi:hypothetical protein
MMVVIHTDSRCTLAGPSMTPMSSLNETLLVNFVFCLDCEFSRIRQRQVDIALINCQSSWFGVQTVCMACMTLSHAQTNYNV